jgi:hypothetical protein
VVHKNDDLLPPGVIHGNTPCGTTTTLSYNHTYSLFYYTLCIEVEYRGARLPTEDSWEIHGLIDMANGGGTAIINHGPLSSRKPT